MIAGDALMERVVRDLPEAPGPIVVATRENRDVFVGYVELNPITVELDFVDPALALRRSFDRRGERGFDECGKPRLNAYRRRLSPLKRHTPNSHRTNVNLRQGGLSDLFVQSATFMVLDKLSQGCLMQFRQYIAQLGRFGFPGCEGGP
jgi:hypothetical protein